MITFRLLVLFIGFGTVFLFYFIVSYKILKHYRNRLNVILSGFYITFTVGILVNFIYSFIYIPQIVLFLNLIANYLIFLSSIFLTVFCITYFKGEENFSKSSQISVICVFAIILSYIFFIPNGVTIDESTNWVPVWNIQFCIFVMLIMNTLSLAPTWVYSIKIYYKIEDQKLKKQWILFMIGLFELTLWANMTFVTFTLNILVVRNAFLTVNALLVVSGSYLLYYSIIKKFPMEDKIDHHISETSLIELTYLRPSKISEEEISFYREQSLCLVCKKKLVGFKDIYICVGCRALYCGACAQAISNLENTCWACNKVIDPSKPVKIPEEKRSGEVDALKIKSK